MPKPLRAHCNTQLKPSPLFCSLFLLFFPFFLAANPAPVALSPEESAYLEQLGPVTMCVDPDWQPYERITPEGNHVGIAADLLAMISSRSGIEFQLVPTSDWEESIAFSREGRCHILSFLNQTPEREQWLLFTEPYFSDYNVFITRQEHEAITDPLRLVNRTIVLPAGTSVEERIRRDYPNLDILITDSEAQAISMVSEGQAHMTMRSRIMAAYTITREGLFNLKIAGKIPEYSNHLRIGVTRDEPMLRDILNKAVSSITEEDVQTAINNHVSIEIQTPYDYTLMIRIGLAILILVLIAFVWNYQLRRLNQKLAAQQKELVIAKQQAEAASKAKSAFLAHMSHEIRTPLNSVIGFTELLKCADLSGENKQFAQYAHSSSRSLLAIINDILDFSKIEAGMLELEHVLCDPRKIIRESVDTIRYQAESKGLALHVHLPGNLPGRMLTDPVRLKQILLNLLGNAVKFTKKGKIELVVEFREDGDNKGAFTFLVRDSGIGISEEHQKRLFQAFMQADHSTTRKYGGSGLGLSISGQLAELMGSKISLSSEVGKGSEFSFVLHATYEEAPEESLAGARDPGAGQGDEAPPADRAQEDAEADRDEQDVDCQQEIRLQGDKPVKILLAEDVDINVRLLKTMIKKALVNVSIDHAADGKEAVEMAASGSYDLILMDIQMPEMDGVEASKLIRQQEKSANKHTPIIALTARAIKEEKEAFLAAGMDDFISKPVNREYFYQVLKKYLS